MGLAYAPTRSKFIKTGSFNRRAHYALAEIQEERPDASVDGALSSLLEFFSLHGGGFLGR